MQKKNKRNLFFIIALMLLSSNLFATGYLFNNNIGHIQVPNYQNSGYEITLQAPDFANTQVILAEYFTTRMIPIDTIQLDASGKGIFNGEELLDGGLYIIFFNPKYYLDFILNREQKLSVKTDSADLINKTIFSNSPENENFYAYKQYLGKMNISRASYLEDLSQARTKEDSSLISKKIDALNDEVTNHINSLIANNSNTFFSTFLLAMKENDAPKEILTGTKRQKDSIRYVYYKNHYFDNFDVGDVRLLHTPIYDQKIKKYINNVVPQHPDSLINAVDYLMGKSRADEKIFRFMLITLFNHFAESKIIGMDKVYFHIAEKYYIPEAHWSDEKFITDLKEKLEKSRHTFIGETAPDFELRGLPKDHILMSAMDTAIKQDPHVGYSFNLHHVEAAYTILYFWEADCGHCKTSTPKLYDINKKYQKDGVKTVAVHVINSIEGKVKWLDFLNEYQLTDWTNCWSPYDNNFRDLYNLTSFPQLFLLDKDKKIIAKRISPEQADEILENLLTKKKK